MKVPIKKLLKNANVDEQGERANVRQNTPPKGFAQQALSIVLLLSMTWATSYRWGRLRPRADRR